MDIEEYFKGCISDANFSAVLNQQHYSFAHKIIPYIMENHFSVLISKIIDKSAQSWILELWNQCAGISIPKYTTAVFPKCHFVEISDKFGLIYFAMPAPRVSPEALYTAIIFFRVNNLSSQWLRAYFTLELGLSTSAHWILGEWDGSDHINLGEFKNEPTTKNFITVVIEQAKNKWLHS